MAKRFIVIFLSFLCLTVPTWAGQKPTKNLYQRLETLTNVLRLVREGYVEEVHDDELIDGAIRGLLATLDPHSVYLSPDLYRELKVDTEGKFGGVGLEITVKNGILTVVTPIEGTPAQKAGIREGDRILRVDGISTKELGMNESIRKMRGPRGSKVSLTIVHAGMKEATEVTLIRQTIRIQSVRTEMPEEGYGYVRVSSFQNGTSEELTKALNGLNKKSKAGLKGLILDLRNNPGGLLDEAVTMADLFLKKGIIVTTQSRSHEVDKREATDDGTEPQYPIVVLVNGGSASAAEIVAGALQDHKRALLLGTQTFGKGSVQTIFDLGEGAALKLTVAKYYTPSGRSIQAKGITPDIIAEAHEARPVISKEDSLHEKDLKGHLQSDKEKKEQSDSGISSQETDSQKLEALNYLKSSQVLQGK